MNIFRYFCTKIELFAPVAQSRLRRKALFALKTVQMKNISNVLKNLFVVLFFLAGFQHAQARLDVLTDPDTLRITADRLSSDAVHEVQMQTPIQAMEDSLVTEPAPLQEIDDTLTAATIPAFAPDRTHKLKLRQVLVPAALVGAASLYVRTDWFTKQKHAVQDALSAKGRHKIKVDDYMQCAPMVAVYGLNLCAVRGQHRLLDRTILLAMSYATMGILINTMKYTIREKRPDSHGRNSFPSGHTATAFMGAEFLWQEYKDVSPWIGYAGYAVAATTGYLRIYNNRHFINDVVAGACIGIVSTKFAYWLYPKIFKKSKCRERMQLVGLPYYANKGAGVSVCMVF